MKRKPNKPKQEPRERPGSWESAADPGGAGAADSGTSGQSVQNMGYPAKSKDFVGRGGAAERVSFAACGETSDTQLATTRQETFSGRTATERKMEGTHER